MLTYDAVGATRDGVVPSGFRPLSREARIGTGRVDFERGVVRVLRWDVQRVAGMRVPATAIAVGDEAAIRIPLLGPVAVTAHARVVYVVREPRLGGFAYGTLRGHPESGEEAFLVEHRADDSVWFVLRAFSRPANGFWRLGDPVARFYQERYTRRYLTALARPLTYEPVGATRDGVVPRGFRALERSIRIDRDWDQTVADLLSWRMKRRAGFRVEPADAPVRVGEELVLRAGPFREPVRIVEVVDEPDRAGFAYGTLPGHPLRGEERFLLRRERGGIMFTVRSVSTPARRWRLAGPLLRLVQRAVVGRYLRAMAG